MSDTDSLRNSQRNVNLLFKKKRRHCLASMDRMTLFNLIYEKIRIYVTSHYLKRSTNRGCNNRPFRKYLLLRCHDYNSVISLGYVEYNVT